MGAPRKPRPTEDEMKTAIKAAAERSANAPCAKSHKTPENLAEIRRQTPMFMNSLLDHGNQQYAIRKSKSKYYDSADELQIEITNFFKLCTETNSPPNVGLLAMWLGCNRDTLLQWENDPTHYLSGTIQKAKYAILAWNTYMAQTNQISAIMAIFTQKTEHGIVETQYINLTAQPGQVRPEQVNDDDFARQAAAAIEAREMLVLSDGTIEQS